jgi:hypothetical protein
MEMYIFLTDAEFDCLFKAVPSVSISRVPLDSVRQPPGPRLSDRRQIFEPANDEQARNLVFYAEAHGKTAVEEIRRALREAGSKS